MSTHRDGGTRRSFGLDVSGPDVLFLNMFKKSDLTPKGRATQARVYDAAMRLFRGSGFDETSMRDIAEAAGLSVGAAYHYFESKDAIVLAYYHQTQTAHEQRWRDTVAAGASVTDRVEAALVTKVDVVQGDRRVLGALLRYAGSSGHRLSFFGPRTRGLQEESVALFREALDGLRLPADLRAAAPRLLWALHMGVLLYLVHDGSAGAERTRSLARGAAPLFVKGLRLLASPFAGSFRRRVIALLEEADLFPRPEEA